MNKVSICASAPGSLMLLGEHAVLHGRRALVCAIDQRMRVSRAPLAEPLLKIDSALGRYQAPLTDLTDHPNFRFVLDVVRQYQPTEGLALTIDSDFSSEIGFGSSAAVTVATHAVMLGPGLDLGDLFDRALATVHRVQGRGSGADLAASVWGGVVAYRADPLEVHPLRESFPLTAVYSGGKMKTADVIRLVEERRALQPAYYEKIFDRMDQGVGEVVDRFSELARALRFNQALMEEMGLCNAALGEIVHRFRAHRIPAKISGSGLGDCAIGLGGFPAGEPAYKKYALRVTTQGVQFESDRLPIL